MDVKGLQEALDLLSESRINGVVDRALQHPNRLIDTFLKNYPSPKGTYQRTGNAKAAWTIENNAFPASVVTRFSNDISYAPYLYDANSQPSWHRGRWQTVEDAVTQFEPEIERAVENELQQELSR